MAFRFWMNALRRSPRNDPAGSAATSAADAQQRPDAVRRPDAGRSLDADVAAKLGRAWGEDLSSVRVHDDAAAHAAARDAGARAFTIGEDIALATGAHHRGSIEHAAILAHEVAHVIQQRRGGDATDATGERRLEQDADQAAIGVLTESAVHAPRLTAPLSLQRCPSGDSDVRRRQAEAAFQAMVTGVTTGPRQPIPIPFPDPDAARGMLDLQYAANREDFIMWQADGSRSPRWEHFYGTNYVDWSQYLQYGDTFHAIWPHFLEDVYNGTIPRARAGGGRTTAPVRAPGP